MNRKQKAAAIKAALAKPYEVGDQVCILSPDGKDSIGPCTITNIDSLDATLDGRGVSVSQGQHWVNDLRRGGSHQIYLVPLSRLELSTLYVGEDPFKDNWRSRAHPVLYTLGTMIHMANEGAIDFDPCITASDGTIHHYQRGLVWNLAQKRDLIETVYEGGDIGTLVLYQTKQCDYEIIDGKQRLSTLIDFVKGNFSDHHGNTFEGLSYSAQARFKNRTRTTCLILPHSATSADILSAFLSINDRGTRVSKAHIQKIKKIPV